MRTGSATARTTGRRTWLSCAAWLSIWLRWSPQKRRLRLSKSAPDGITPTWSPSSPKPQKVKCDSPEPADQRSESASLFGAICPARGMGAALALPFANTDAMQLHLDEIARTVARGAHAVLRLDRAGWHTTTALRVPKTITMILLPSRAPELNPVENIWQYLRQNWLSPASSTPTRRSSKLPATPGASSSHSPDPSPQSECA